MTIPNLLYGGFGGRHSVLPSIGFIFLLFSFLFFLNFKYRNYLYSFLVFFLVLVSQGNMWSQVVSLRIVNNVFQSISQNKDIILKSDNVLYDINSFKKNINYSLVNNSYNNFNTYFGSQLFEDWSLTSMIDIATNQKFNGTVYISSNEINKVNNDNFKFSINEYLGYNKIKIKEFIIPVNNTFIIDYKLVYKNDFKYGN